MTFRACLIGHQYCSARDAISRTYAISPFAYEQYGTASLAAADYASLP